MPNSKSAKKRMRRVEKQTLVNRSRKNKYRTLVKEIRILIESENKEKNDEVIEFINKEISKKK